jgi:hypothetical protein
MRILSSLVANGAWVFRLALPIASLYAPRAVAAQVDTTTATAPRALRELLADASKRNVLPPSLISFRSNVETEISVLLRREEGNEAVAAVEQVASTLKWNRTGFYDQHIVGYRAQQTGPNNSMLSVFQTGWLNPVLYGNRLRVRSNSSQRTVPGRASTRSDGADTLPAIHPLAVDREQYYRYSGGDTIVTVRAGDRVIPIAHVRVQPLPNVKGALVLFDGEMDLDASRGTLVRLRGRFLRVNGPRRGLVESLGDAVAFVEYENGERYGEFWLPAKQRIELQATLPILGDGRAVIRIVSRFSQLDVNDTVLDARTLASADSLRARSRRRLSFAGTDSLGRYGAWQADVGALSVGMHSDDFNDIGPDRWRSTGAPRLDYTVPRASDAFHFNRVEGVYTGTGLKWSLRDLAPGVVVRANAGWAWAEGTPRGRLSVERQRGSTLMEVRGGRSLDNTNDFRVPLDSGNTIAALFASRDPYDYVDRRSATIAAVRTLGARRLLTRVEFGVADDRYRPSSYVRSPFGGDAYRENRRIDEGRYLRSAALVEWHPDFSAEFAKPGVGARLSYERGDGTLQWQRAEIRATARKPFGPFVALARGDVGAVFGSRIPPQQLFELGKFQNLPGYEDKEFAGSRAAVLRASLHYTSPYFRQPIRVGRLLLALAPGLSVGVQSGWADAPTAPARTSIERLGAPTDTTLLALWAPVARPTDGIRASLTAGLRLFSGGVFVGATRKVDQAAPWKALVTFGQQW